MNPYENARYGGMCWPALVSRVEGSIPKDDTQGCHVQSEGILDKRMGNTEEWCSLSLVLGSCAQDLSSVPSANK